MKIVNNEIKIRKVDNPSSKYFENEMKKAGYDFIRWAIVNMDEQHFILNVSYKIINCKIK